MLSVHCGPEKTMSSNSMQKPTRVLHTHAHLNKVRMSVYTPMSIYYFLHSNDKLKFLRFQWIESQASVNAFVAFSIRRQAFFYFSNYMSCRICACLFHAWNSLLLSCSQQIGEHGFTSRERCDSEQPQMEDKSKFGCKDTKKNWNTKNNEQYFKKITDLFFFNYRLSSRNSSWKHRHFLRK